MLSIKEDGNFYVIKGFPIQSFLYDTKRVYRTSKLSKLIVDSGFITIFGLRTIKIHKFFIPELYYILHSLPSKYFYRSIASHLLTDTWLKNTLNNYPSNIDYSRINKNISSNFSLKSYQKEFLDLYDDRKNKYFLEGYILAFEQGLGKTLTSLSLMEGLNKDVIIIIAPKNTMRTVWSEEIKKAFVKPQDIWVVGDTPKKARFYILNYESIEKYKLISKFIKSDSNVGIIVDECHNFRFETSKRSLNLINMKHELKCKDTLLMSGTPIKAMGYEMIPTMYLIDPFFDKDARQHFVNVFGLNATFATDVLKNRLGLMMHRKMKKEVLNLPEKYESDILIKTPNSKKYELDEVKKQVLDYTKQQYDHYRKFKSEYDKMYDECVDYLKTIHKNDPRFHDYLATVEKLKKRGYDRFNKELVKEVKLANDYEKEVLYPSLTPELKHKFKKSKAVVKYVDLKIRGEVLGGLLSKLRSEMYAEMFRNSPVCNVVKDSLKKTIMFTSYVDVVDVAAEYVHDTCKMKPILVYGKTAGNIKVNLDNFKNIDEANPLIATIQSLSTGVTLVEANTVIFLNPPWRHVDKSQAMDRVHRIGQTSDVYVFNFVLDTGGRPNLSTRMEDIISWSKEMFEAIVGKEETLKVEDVIVKNYKKYIEEFVLNNVNQTFNENRSLKTIHKVINNKQFSNQLTFTSKIGKKTYEKKNKDKDKEKDKK